MYPLPLCVLSISCELDSGELQSAQDRQDGRMLVGIASGGYERGQLSEGKGQRS